ncbi:MAG TPA: hypothetical protein VK995_04425, partial [Oceanipulchritudo sp.]|nr:hypothetical protein [Oceanipulchritudo sp.]
MKNSYDGERERFERAGQGQVFSFWNNLDQAGQETLCGDARSIDLAEVANLVDTLVKGQGEQDFSCHGLDPAPYIRHPRHGGEASLWEKAYAAGEAAL